MPKYGEPIWSLVLKAAKEVLSPFTAEAIVNKIHQTHPDIPAVSIRTYITAMTPNTRQAPTIPQPDETMGTSPTSETEDTG